MKLQIKPIHLKAAGEFVKQYHRHNIPPTGGKFAVACYNDAHLCGVAICGRPVSRYKRNYFISAEELKCRWEYRL